MELSQERLAALAGVAKNTAINWEKDKSSPTAAALISLAEAGADAVYILTGKREPKRPDLNDTYYSLRLSEIENSLLDPTRQKKPDEKEEDAEARILLEARKEISSIIEHESPSGLSNNTLEQANHLIDIIDNPSGLSLIRAANFVQKRKRLDEERELLSIWLENWPYQPDEPVLKLMASIAVEYDVPHQRLVELSDEIYRDLQEQRWAEDVIDHHDRNHKTKPEKP